MSVVVNGHADENASQHRSGQQPNNPTIQTLHQPPASQPHNFHNNPMATHIRNPPVAPTLSFSLATPEDEAVDEDDVMISMAAPPSAAPPVAAPPLNRASSPDAPSENPPSTEENAPLLNLHQVVEDHSEGVAEEDDDEDHSERSPLLGSGLQLNMPRRSSSHIGIAFENDESPGSSNPQQMNGELSPSPTSASASSFARSKSESENLSVTNNRSPPTTLNLDRTTSATIDLTKTRTSGDCEGLLQNNAHLIEVANKFVCEIISKAKEEAMKKMFENKRGRSRQTMVTPERKQAGPSRAKALRRLSVHDSVRVSVRADNGTTRDHA
ncbi:uncharacterized protein LOC143034247 [Oratosquilla oratoria]|uniref:uncharacterized protein LOC143034247 n=1 Tax=Oratosquilla oratoria TaxID=337810 RepID=UPI003F76FC2A